ncbi:methyltransferase, FxLD system [Sphaerisporangium sp. NPDC051017]|uniref:methyltransferase, FxLD system n=1 Tax=Sphaerisporangium sp. NPDC051017 TaxID=3154636 RepID=UPI0034279C7C
MEADPMTANHLRTSMVTRLRDWDGGALPPSVDAAMRAVPREAFLPGTPLADAYGSSPVVTHRDDNGIATSSASAPGIVAAMLAQLDVRPGHRILEIGAGTGYNAALLAHLTGPGGQVTTVELDHGVAAEAEQALATTGYGHVTVIPGDGEYGHRPNAPYDRIIVTVGAWELPAAWADQLAPAGLLVVPFRMRGLTRSVTFEHTAGTWRSRSMHECGFMPIRGAGAVAERNIPLADTGLTIRIDDGQPADADALRRALSSGPAQSWTGIEVTVTGELDFWLAGLDGFFRLLAGNDAVQRSGIVPPAFNWGAMGLLTGDSFAYLTRRPGRPGHSELGACGYGPEREQLISTYTDRIRAFNRSQAGRLQVEVHPLTGAPLPGTLMQIDKRNSRVIVLTEGEVGREALGAMAV